MQLPIKHPNAAEEKRFKEVRDRLLRAVRLELERGDVTADQLLAILSLTVGQVIAMQDQRMMTPDQAMSLVVMNIEAGNKAALDELLKSDGGSH